MAFLYNKLSRRILLSLILIWATASFWFLSQSAFPSVIVIVLGLIALVLTWLEYAPIYLLIVSSFMVSYALYGFFFQFSLPVWLVMLAIILLFGYIFVYTEQKIGILGNKRLIYLLLFSIITLELFLALNYFLISPLSKSLIISIICYLFVGFCYTVLARHDDSKLKTYIIIALFLIVLIFSSSIWGVGI